MTALVKDGRGDLSVNRDSDDDDGGGSSVYLSWHPEIALL